MEKGCGREECLLQSTTYELLLTWGKTVDLGHTGIPEETIAPNFLCISDSFIS